MHGPLLTDDCLKQRLSTPVESLQVGEEGGDAAQQEGPHIRIRGVLKLCANLQFKHLVSMTA
jgi:hypothetical protein